MVRYLPDNPFVNKIISEFIFYYYFISELIYIFIIRFFINRKAYKKKNPFVSVYIPTYNRSSILINRAIKTVLAQTYKNFELIIVDDGSTDDTEEAVKKINDPRIRYFKIIKRGYRYPNKSIYHWFAGPVIAANYGLKKCKGVWIARIDDDDEWTKNHLEKSINFAVKHNAEFISAALKINENNKTKIITAFDDPKDYTGIGATQTWLYRDYLKFFKYNINCWRKSYFKVNDTDLAQRLYFAGVRIYYLNQITALIKPRPNEKYVGSKAYLTSQKKYEKFYSIN